jgi:hypothetical protein
VNEYTDEPMMIASARVHSTWYIIAVAPEIAYDSTASRRSRSGLGSSEAACASSALLLSSPSLSLLIGSLARSGAFWRRCHKNPPTRISVAKVRLVPAPRRFVRVTPSRGSKMKPDRNVPTTAPVVFIANSVPIRTEVPTSPVCFCDTYCDKSGSVAPISVVGTISTSAVATKRKNDSSTK